MENKKDIGKAISDKLSSLDKSPREQVWSGISYELQKKKKRRSAFFFFWGKTTGFVLIGAMVALYIYNQANNINMFSPENSKDTVTVNDTNNTNNNVKKSTADSNKENSKTKNIQTGTNNVIAKDGISTIDENSAFDENGIINKNSGTAGKGLNRSKVGVNNKNKDGSKNAIANENMAKGKSKDGSSKSGRTNNFSKISSKSSKNRSAQLLKKAKSKEGKSTKKSETKSTKSNEKSNNENIDISKALTDGAKTKEKEAITDLSSLQGKDSAAKTEDIKAKKRDSLIAKKEKEKEININMHPKDSIEQDSTKFARKFYADAFISPTFYGYFSKESVLDKDLDSLSKKSETTFAYGFGLTYDLTKRLSIRIGYRKINIRYLTKNAPLGINIPEADTFSGIIYNPEVSNTSIYLASDGSETMDITQKISYTEIPLEVKYNFLTKKLGLKSSFGFSYLMLNENKISIWTFSSHYTQDIGKTRNLTPTSVSVNFGLEVDYPILKDLKIFVEPMLNYQMKAFSEGNYKPYIFGIHTGLRYGF
jgi:opacity protein-like surface antigen